MFTPTVVYLAGLISTDYPESITWRKSAQAQLEAEGFIILSPMRGKENLAQGTKDGGITFDCINSRSIILRDRGDVRRANIIFMHLEDFGSPRPLLGTIAEAAWAFDQQTPIVGIASKDNYLMRNHPFMSQFITYYVETVDQGVAFIVKNFKIDFRGVAAV